ncbi:MAG TPA: hypothetical protein VK432_07060 [Stellaceae bacterium]|nr:hypothetical protein [Stellaceae bacterium]
MYSDESCGMPPGGGSEAGGCASAGNWVFGCWASGAAAGGASWVAPPVVTAAGVAVGVEAGGGEARFDGLGTGWEE